MFSFFKLKEIVIGVLFRWAKVMWPPPTLPSLQDTPIGLIADKIYLWEEENHVRDRSNNPLRTRDKRLKLKIKQYNMFFRIPFFSSMENYFNFVI